MAHGREYERLRIHVLERDGYRCRDCGRAGRLEVHHVKALHLGGTNDPANLLALCLQCHVKAHEPAVNILGLAEWRDFTKML